MKKIVCALAIAGIVLSGCVMAESREPVPGQYKDYRQMLVFNALNWHWKDVPPKLESDLKDCTIDVMVDSLSSEDLARMDAYARAEIKLSSAERRALEQRMRRSMDDPAFDRTMNSTCPSTMTDLAEFRAKNG